MNRLQITSLVLALSCIDSKVLGGLLPGGNSGYQYNRPDGETFANGLSTGGFDGRAGGGYSENIGVGSGGNFGGRPSTLYGVLGFGGGRGFGGGFSGGGNFGRKPSGSYEASGFGGNLNEYQAGVGGRYQGIANGGYRGSGNINEDNGRPRPYDFQYEVRDPPSGNNYAQQESSDGNSVRGEYRVLLPDSRTQIVKYSADNVNGYNADVQYEGQAQYSQGGGAGGYQGGFGGSGYQSGGSGFVGQGGGLGIGNFASGSGGGTSNQYLPPSGGYGK